MFGKHFHLNVHKSNIRNVTKCLPLHVHLPRINRADVSIYQQIKKIHNSHFSKIVCGLNSHLMNEKTSLFCKQQLAPAHQRLLVYDSWTNQIAAFASTYQKNSTCFRLNKVIVFSPSKM